jgi:hypothetical protein
MNIASINKRVDHGYTIACFIGTLTIKITNNEQVNSKSNKIRDTRFVHENNLIFNSNPKINKLMPGNMAPSSRPVDVLFLLNMLNVKFPVV